MLSLSNRLAWRVLILACLLPVALLLSGCDDEELMAPDPEGGDRFARYVSLGNSITAGFQANGINSQTQQTAYPVLLARQMGTSFNIPALALPGCPPPVTNLLTGDRVGPDDAPLCALRETPVPTVINNVAVPGANIASATSNDPDDGATVNPLTTFILGGQTQAEAAATVEPTFASVWLGNNDALGAALAGTPAALTPLQAFEDRYTAALDALEEAGAESGILIGVAAPVTLQPISPTAQFALSIPNLSAGQVYFGAEAQINSQGAAVSPQWGRFNVANSCAPGQPGANTLVPYEYGVGALFALAAQGQTVTLDCTNNQTLNAILGPNVVDALEVSGRLSLLLPGETAAIEARVEAYNAFIRSAAQERGWAFVNPQTVFTPLLAAGLGTPDDPSDDLVPLFPNLSASPTPMPPTFGRFFSEDGVHPSDALHRVITNEVIGAINEQYGSGLPPLEEVATIPGAEN